MDSPKVYVYMTTSTMVDVDWLEYFSFYELLLEHIMVALSLRSAHKK